MNKFNSFFDNLFPLRPLVPFVQSVLPTVFDDSLSYLETLGKVVKALNDTTSNVNTLEQAVRAFADDLALYENLSITPVEITYNSGSGAPYTASMTYADIVSALNEGHTVIMHVSGSVYDSGIEFYSAALKTETTGENVRVLYWDSPVYIVDGDTVIYRAWINDGNVSGVMRRVIGGSGSSTLFVRYDSTKDDADKTYTEIMGAINDGVDVVLIADGYYISNAHVSDSFVEFVTGSLVSYSDGYNLGVIQYTLTNNNSWSVLRRGFPDTARVDAMIDAKINGLDGLKTLPDTTNASAHDFLMLDANKNPAWVAVPNAATVKFGGV